MMFGSVSRMPSVPLYHTRTRALEVATHCTSKCVGNVLCIQCGGVYRASLPE